MARFLPIRRAALTSLAAFLLLSPLAAGADDGRPDRESEATVQPGVPAGHSQHGEAFNDGPRQKAYIMSGVGNVHFTPSTSNDQAARFTRQGIGQLHGFWYFEAERSFRQAAVFDPDYAFAYWGMAMANVNNEKRARGFIEEAVARRDHASPLERRMIDAHAAFLAGKDPKQRAIDYARAMKAITADFPDEIEPKAFLAYLHWKYSGHLKRKPETTDKLIQEVLHVEPMHPVHHYRIHLWDLVDPARALDSAARCGPAAPDIAHMWHMPGHIYSRLKRYSDAAWQQEASARVDHAHMMRDRVMPDQIHNFAHNNEWFIRNMIFIGRWRDALDLAKNMTELPRHPRYNTFKRRGSAWYGRQRLLQVLRSYELWSELIELAGQPYLEPTDQPKLQTERLRWLGAAHAALGHVAEAQAIRNELAEQRARLQRILDRRKPSGDSPNKDAKPPAAAITKNAAPKKKTPKKKTSKKKGKAGRAASKPSPEAIRIKEIARAMTTIDGYLAWHRGDWKTAMDRLKTAKIDPLVLARLQSLSGAHQAAIDAAARLVKQRENQVLPLAAQVEILHRAGRVKECRAAFESLRSISGDIQPDAPPFDRLAPIAAELGLPADWRRPRVPAKDLGERPALDSLGPFRWSPQPAPPWQLFDTHGTPFTLEQFKGKPVIVIFYLGFGCLHCAEQLRAFAPMSDEFRKSGIKLIAISTDSPEDLKKSIDDYPGGMPFPLVADEKLRVFRAYRVYDDFEQVPLHGTFLIDAKGNVRWQDISYEPFMKPKFLLRESLRLLAQ